MANSNQLFPIINKQVANWTVLYMKLHNFHWYVKGHHFFVLHEKFEELYNEAALNLDELAERLLAIEGKPIATLKESLELASINEAEGNEDTDTMVQTIIDDFSTLVQELKKGMDVASQAGDDATEDMFLAIQQNLEKHNWMLKAYLAK